MGKVSEKMEEIKALLLECEIDHLEEVYELHQYKNIDTRLYAYWLVHSDTEGNLDDLIDSLRHYGGIK